MTVLLFRGPAGLEAHSVPDLLPALAAGLGDEAVTAFHDPPMPGGEPVDDLGHWYARDRGLEYLGVERAGKRLHGWSSEATELAHLQRVCPDQALALAALIAHLNQPARVPLPPDPYWAEREAEHKREAQAALEYKYQREQGARALRATKRAVDLISHQKEVARLQAVLKLEPTNAHTRKDLAFHKSVVKSLSKPDPRRCA